MSSAAAFAPTCYRFDAEEVLRRRAEIAEDLGRELARVGPLVELGSRRRARATAGAVAVAVIGGVVTGAVSLVALPIEMPEIAGFAVLWASVAAAFAALPIARLVARPRSRRFFDVPRGGEPRADVERLRRVDVLARAAEWSIPVARGSFAWPLAGIVALLPLVMTTSWIVYGGRTPHDVAVWMALSTLFATHCHIVLALFCRFYAGKLAGRFERITPIRSAYGHLALTALIGAVPTVIYVPAVVVACGVLPLPIMYWVAARVARREHELVARFSPTS